jgi:hypothetical protein
VTTLKVHTRKCIVCKAPFEVSGKAAGRAKTCSAKCRKARQYQHQSNWRKRQAEFYDPWLWENTILDWNE